MGFDGVVRVIGVENCHGDLRAGYRDGDGEFPSTIGFLRGRSRVRFNLDGYIRYGETTSLRSAGNIFRASETTAD